MDINLKPYLSDEVVTYYSESKDLQNPEETILKLLADKLPAMRMLDIGVGAGRTTVHFAHRVKQYQAIDYSEKMIAACKKRFEGKIAENVFSVLDIRNLGSFPENSFDFVLFSFNGIDHISMDERITAFQDIRKTLSSGGYFCFSTHNIQCIPNWLNIQFRWNVFEVVKRIFRQAKVKTINKQALDNYKAKDYVLLNDGAHDFGSEIHYARPSWQIKSLKQCGFNEIRIFSLKTGAELTSEGEISANIDKWLYFLCF